MEPLLFLVHRIPFPPNKGDKIRSYHLLRHLARRHEVHVGTFVDAADDMAHVPELARFAASHHVEPLDARTARLRSVRAFLTGEALTLPYYRSAALQRWVQRTVSEHGIRKAVVFSGAMAQYVRGLDLHVVLDFVDVDSAKWSQYADHHRWPSSFVYRREGERLLSFERNAAAGSASSVFVTRAEADLFEQLAPECKGRVRVIEMGVDTQYFCPDVQRRSPFAAGESAVVFTGAMDYWPNIDAAVWFAREVMPKVRSVRPDARFYAVGMRPAAAVSRLAEETGAVVTGKVDDVRPYLQHAAVVVAPLRVARGIQSKVLEAMAMARPVVTTPAAGRSIRGLSGREFETASDAGEFAQKVVALSGGAVAQAMGQRARQQVISEYNWERNLADYDALLAAGAGAGVQEAC